MKAMVSEMLLDRLDYQGFPNEEDIDIDLIEQPEDPERTPGNYTDAPVLTQSLPDADENSSPTVSGNPSQLLPPLVEQPEDPEIPPGDYIDAPAFTQSLPDAGENSSSTETVNQSEQTHSHTHALTQLLPVARVVSHTVTPSHQFLHAVPDDSSSIVPLNPSKKFARDDNLLPVSVIPLQQPGDAHFPYHRTIKEVVLHFGQESSRAFEQLNTPIATTPIKLTSLATPQKTPDALFRKEPTPKN